MCGVPFAAFILSPPIRLKTFHASRPLSPSRPKNAARVGPVMQVKDPSSEDESLPDNDLLSRLNSVPDATRKPGRSQHLVDSPGRIREVYTYFTEQLRPDIEGLLENPFNLISLAFIAILFGFFAATSAATIIGSVADWDPLAAAVLLVWTEGFTKYYYGLKDKSRLLQLINAFKIGLIYGMTVDAFKLRGMQSGQGGITSSTFVSPSEQDGISRRAETNQLAYAADLIRECCLTLRLSQSACSTAQMFFHRFYARVSLRAHPSIWAAGAAILLSAKLADQPRNLRHISNAIYDRLGAWEGTKDVVDINEVQRRRPLDFFGVDGYDWKHELIAIERHILKELGFRLRVELPHKFVLIFVNTLRDKGGAPAWTDPSVKPFRAFLQHSWNYANDVMRIRLCICEEPEVIAVACIALGAQKSNIQLPEGWQIVFGSNKDECVRLEKEILHSYAMPSSKGLLLDFSMTPAFERFHPKKPTQSTKRARSFSDTVLTGQGEIARKKRSRFG